MRKLKFHFRPCSFLFLSFNLHGIFAFVNQIFLKTKRPTYRTPAPERGCASRVSFMAAQPLVGTWGHWKGQRSDAELCENGVTGHGGYCEKRCPRPLIFTIQSWYGLFGWSLSHRSMME